MSIARQLCGRFVRVDMSISVSGCVCLGHVKWRWCFGDKNTVLQGETHTQFGNGSAGAGDGDAAGACAGALAGAGAGVAHANIVVKFVLVPVGVVCACAGAPDEVAAGGEVSKGSEH